jgi:hypothetical protein
MLADEILRGDGLETPEAKNLLETMGTAGVRALKFAPITSCEVERSFSIRKAIFRPNRQSFNLHNLSMYTICNYHWCSDA